MKFLILLTVVAFVAADLASFSEEKRKQVIAIKDKCLPETDAAPDVLEKLLAGDFSNTDKSTKCFTKCFYEKAGIFDKDDNLDVKVSLEKLTKDYGAEKAEKWVTACKGIDHKDPCEKAYEIYQCVYKHKHPKE